MLVRRGAWAAVAAWVALLHLLLGAGTAAAQGVASVGVRVATQSSARAPTAPAALLPVPEAPNGAAATDAPARIATDINEAIARVPVDLVLLDGKRWRGDMVVTHYKPAGNGPFPVVVLSHGRASATRHEPARWRSLSLARYWVRRGFAVLVPTRVGYGELGQEVDPEAAGSCSRADFKPAVAAMGTQIEAAVVFAATLPWADPKRVILSGVSYGGFATLGATARRIPGVIGAINFAGGLGGNPQARPEDPCQGERITQIAAEAGAKSRVPMLWLYASNDRYWGDKWPRRWHEAFSAAGGIARFASLPAVGEDGHKLMNEGFTLWRPVVDGYLASLGLDPPRAPNRLPDSKFAAIVDAEKLPHVKDTVKSEGYAKFLAADVPRAFAISPSGAWAWRSGPDAVGVALARCQTHSRTPCTLYAVDDRVVWKPSGR